ncbi:sigma-70 family RNA polymerase sigma factor [Thiolapillus sp.]|uniref:sigma-70 family RNA polymerase sigma factor n=1 Tax=Thiolapillus sp. TaxID=2017437 RepID=UPI003AF43891
MSYDDLSADGWVSDEDDEDDEQDGPLPELQKDLFKEGLSTAISSLPEREQMVLSLYYDNEFNLREIGEVLGVSEARICQIHAQALTRLRSKMSDWVGDEDD